MQGHLRATLESLETLTVEDIEKDPDQFGSLVRQVASRDVGRMGIEILDFTIKGVCGDKSSGMDAQRYF